MTVDLRAYRDRPVLVTGHTGFKGGWLAVWLERLGARVVGLSLEAPSQPNLFSAIHLDKYLTHLHVDIRDAEGLERAMAEHRPEVVFHLAAQPLVRRSYQEPDLTFDTNVMGTLRVFEAVRRSESVRALVNVTSDKCYENQEWVWGYRENDPMGGRDPYSASKGCAELLFGAWFRSYFSASEGVPRVGAASVRAGNVLGGGDWGEDRLLPDCYRALSDGQPIEIRAPKATRPWQHVLEPLSGYLKVGAGLLAAPDRFGGAWNFGPRGGDDWEVEAIVREVCTLWGEGSYVVTNRDEPHEAHWLKLDCAKAHHGLGWHARWDVRRTLQETTKWYRAFYEGASPTALRALCMEQIELYESEPLA